MRTLIRWGGLALLTLLGSCKDEVVEVVPVASVEVSGPGTVVAGTTAQFTATPKDDRGNTLTSRSITWSTSNGSYATVNSSGTVSGVLGGQVTIIASCEGLTGNAPLQVNNPVPSVSGTDPAMATAESEGFDLTVTGSGFVSTSVVRWNGADRATTRVSTSELRATIQASDIAQAGTAQVQVFNPTPGGGLSGTLPLPVGNPGPVLTSVSPDHATVGDGATTVTLSGTRFTASSSASLAGEPRPTTFISVTRIQVTLPASDFTEPGWRILTVTNPAPGGGTSEPQPFPIRIPFDGPYLATGESHSCALNPAGQAFCWGYNNDGELGNGTIVDSAEPVPTLSPPGFSSPAQKSGGSPFPTPDPERFRLVSLGGGNFHTCGLDEVGRAYCWGRGYNGQLGNGTKNGSDRPSPVSGEASFLSLDGGIAHTCAVDSHGKTWCWGYNAVGQVGDGTLGDQVEPTPVAQGPLTFSKVKAGGFFSCGLTVEGQVHCWGRNNRGQLGDGTQQDRTTPTLVVGLTSVTDLTLGDEHACARTESGGVLCWGNGGSGQLGNGSFNIALVPTPVAGGYAFQKIRALRFHTCGITSTGAALCWGYGFEGQLGQGQLMSSGTPVQVLDLSDVAEIAPGYTHTCARTGSGELSCWGAAAYGQLGNGEVSYRFEPTPVVGGPPQFAFIGMGGSHTCGLGTSGRVFCWGSGDSYQLGTGDHAPRSTPVEMTAGPDFSSLTVGEDFNCGLTDSGQAYCWGSGRLGNGMVSSQPYPVAVSGGHVFQQLDAGHEHVCGVSASGEVLCWGTGSSGQLGNGDQDNRDVPTPISTPEGETFVMAGGGYYFSCALSDKGEVWCWGDNYYGTLGDGTFNTSLVPVRVLGLPTSVARLSIGSFHSCALDESGQAYCWGGHYSGELGGTYSEPQNTAQPVSGDYSFQTLSAGSSRTCVTSANGEGFCFGNNQYGQMGTGDTYPSPHPTPIAGGHLWTRLGEGPGGWHNCGVTLEGRGYCWGWQRSGSLGIGTLGTHSVPTPVLGGLTVGPPDWVAPQRVAPASTRRVP